MICMTSSMTTNYHVYVKGKGNIDNSALQNVNLFFLLHVGHCCQCYFQVDVEI